MALVRLIPRASSQSPNSLYVWLDATFLKVRENGRVVSEAVVIAIDVKATGEREIPALLAAS